MCTEQDSRDVIDSLAVASWLLIGSFERQTLRAQFMPQLFWRPVSKADAKGPVCMEDNIVFTSFFSLDTLSFV